MDRRPRGQGGQVNSLGVVADAVRLDFDCPLVRFFLLLTRTEAKVKPSKRDGALAPRLDVGADVVPAGDVVCGHGTALAQCAAPGTGVDGTGVPEAVEERNHPSAAGFPASPYGPGRS